MLEQTETPSLRRTGLRHEDIFGGTWPTVRVLMSYMTMLPLHQQLAHWNEARAAGGFKNGAEAASYLVPEWLKRYLKDRVLKLPEEVTFSG